ncbi:hypothetical protein pdam_00008041 [Pocillopora damicornis]|uniref:Uncharacterized protein n=1 Tax=Pocillopora damicornis TaxID=46731 RepID=A0A3M6TEE8_POCDA|nr:hypothetical protein pdam_00008041 [Pocillopora damicornis]
MKPHVESVEISSPMDITDGEYGEEQQTWSISVTNLPNDVFEDQETKRRSSLNNNSNLKPPPQTKQFLISPPASPPVGWEQTLESHPVINYDLLAAVATLDTSQPCQLHKSVEDAPSIVVHLCDEGDVQDGMNDEGSKFHPLKALPREVVQTKRPERKL